jgi:hypothetical protein
MHAASIQAIVRPRGGIIPVAGKRSARAPMLAERGEILRGIRANALHSVDDPFRLTVRNFNVDRLVLLCHKCNNSDIAVCS